eukprot:CAMPEP_0174751624 /NCGR_PEP_ID=MMETSP1094-20130205/100250_1 /TAXON_ID=156173 /ORGANISM="Chrysochromulina brevifilum, Strain UTEX LB 985" /LENGTH=66 /DNA_ID=CAMNT_0015957149 /DNA_START=61 /DNA_END=258 /DNA_ORIENTATION=-
MLSREADKVPQQLAVESRTVHTRVDSQVLDVAHTATCMDELLFYEHRACCAELCCGKELYDHHVME